ncbi:MAG: hypothetical protein LBN24_04120 [Mediterranea sp.]|nr:hypothetical protein [Mediterranea sp.]
MDKTTMSCNLDLLPLGLFGGKMGLSIYFFHLAKIQGDFIYWDFAKSLIKDIYTYAPKMTNIEFSNGLSGIAWGFHYLFENHFVSGDINDILKEVDDVLFRTIHPAYLWGEDTQNRCEFLWILFYYSDRLKTIENPVEKRLMQKTVMTIINHIEDFLPKIQWEHPLRFDLTKNDLPLYLLLLHRFYQYGFFNDKIEKIWEELSPSVLSLTPTLHINRVHLLYGMRSVLQSAQITGWAAHAKSLEESIDHERILRKELLDKNVTLRTGVAGYALLMFWLYGPSFYSSMKQQLLDRIEASEIWQERFNPQASSISSSFGLLDGYVGPSLICHTLLNMSET